MTQEPIDFEEIDNAAFELSRQLNRLAYELAAQDDIYGVAFVCRQSQQAERIARAVKVRFRK